ncbi:hypothetical protein S40288_03688, partial [Stachybotrys chartarum IBT 40288]
MHYKPYVALAMGNIVLAQVTTPGVVLSPLNSDLPGPVQPPSFVSPVRVYMQPRASVETSVRRAEDTRARDSVRASPRPFADRAAPFPSEDNEDEESDESDDAELTASNPSSIGDFQYYGCVESGDRFSTFSVLSSTNKMTLDFCAASCPTRFFGVYNTDCYCGQEISDRNIRVVPGWECGVHCPGNELERCGGVSRRVRKTRREVAMDVLLSVYIRISDSSIDSSDRKRDSDDEGMSSNDNRDSNDQKNKGRKTKDQKKKNKSNKNSNKDRDDEDVRDSKDSKDSRDSKDSKEKDNRDSDYRGPNENDREDVDDEDERRETKRPQRTGRTEEYDDEDRQSGRPQTTGRPGQDDEDRQNKRQRTGRPEEYNDNERENDDDDAENRRPRATGRPGQDDEDRQNKRPE